MPRAAADHARHLTTRRKRLVRAMSRSRPAIDVSRHLIDPGRLSDVAPADRVVERFRRREARRARDRLGEGALPVQRGEGPAGRELPGHRAFQEVCRACRGAAGSSGTDERQGVVRGWAARSGRVVPAGSLRAVHVYFPDPWWKTRHKKRRVFTGPLVREIERTLSPGGELNVASDVAEYFGVMRGLIGASERFRELELPAPAEPAHALDYLTHFERKYRLEGRRDLPGAVCSGIGAETQRHAWMASTGAVRSVREAVLADS